VSVETQRALQGDGQITSGRIGRRLSAVLAADLAGYSRLMGRDTVDRGVTIPEYER
jgi:class 3 adenylate cyclase